MHNIAFPGDLTRASFSSDDLFLDIDNDTFPGSFHEPFIKYSFVMKMRSKEIVEFYGN